MDHTQRLLADLENPAKFEKVSAPVFRAHTRQFKETRDAAGNLVRPADTVTVTDADLERMAAELNAQVRAGHLMPLTVGHRDFRPDADEAKQPTLVGFAKNFRVETVGRGGERFRALVEDEYIMRDHAAVLRQYPYRSIDFDIVEKTSVGTALLVRPPHLPMGTTVVGYQAPVIACQADAPYDPHVAPPRYAETMTYLLAHPGMSYEAARSHVVGYDPPAVPVVAYQNESGEPPDMHTPPPRYGEIMAYLLARPGCGYEAAKLKVLVG